MTRGTRWLLHAANLAVGGTGLVYAVMRYLMEPVEPWDVVNHPWQPHLQHLHVLAAPLLVFAAGLLWESHVRPRWERTAGAAGSSGRGLVWLLAPMVASGYLLQVATEPLWRQVWVILHLLTSGAWLAAFAVHWLVGRNRDRGAAEVEVSRGNGEPVAAPPAYPREDRGAPAGRGAPGPGGDRRRAAAS